MYVLKLLLDNIDKLENYQIGKHLQLYCNQCITQYTKKHQPLLTYILGRKNSTCRNKIIRKKI